MPARQPQVKKLMIIDWDNTIYPTFGLGQYTVAQLYPPNMRKKLKALFQSSVNLFDAFDGDIVIITNATSERVQRILDGSENYFTTLALQPLKNALKEKNIDIVSAKDMYKKRTGNRHNNTEAKKLAFKQYLKKWVKGIPADAMAYVMSIGDGLAEFEASKYA
eukprot:392512_1